MSKPVSDKYLAQTEYLPSGPPPGVSAPDSAANLRIMSDKVVIPVGAPAVATTDYIRFSKVPAGAVVYPGLVLLSTTNPTAITGRLQFVPVDGVGTTQEITGFTVNEPDALLILNNGRDTVILKDSWVQFVPTANLTIATTPKEVRIRLPYGQTY